MEGAFQTLDLTESVGAGKFLEILSPLPPVGHAASS